MPWAGQVCGWGRCPSARVAERMGTPVLGPGPSCPPSRGRLRFSTVRTRFSPRRPGQSEASAGSSRGKCRGNPRPLRRFLEPCFLFLCPRLGLEALLFQVGRKRGQSWSWWRWSGAGGASCPSSWMGPGSWSQLAGVGGRDFCDPQYSPPHHHPPAFGPPPSWGTVLGENGRDSWNPYRLFWKAVLGARGLGRTDTTPSCQAVPGVVWCLGPILPPPQPR